MNLLARVRWSLASLAFMACSLAAAQGVPKDRLIEQLRAVDFPTRTAGVNHTVSGITYLNLNVNGYIETAVGGNPETGTAIPNDEPTTRATGSTHRIVIRAFGSAAGPATNTSSWPVMQLWVDGTLRASQTVNTTTPTNYTFDQPIRAGMRNIRIAYTNDATVGTADRNLYIDRLTVTGPARVGALPSGAGSFPMQSISVLSGMFSVYTDVYGSGATCDNTKPGCRNIDFVKAVGGNDVTLVTVCTISDPNSWCSPDINYNANEAALRAAIRKARALGLTVTLKPFVLRNGAVLNGWTPPDPSTFFTSIEANLKRHAQIAREEGASLLMLGAEMGGTITSALPMHGYFDNLTRWRSLIAAVRQTAAAVTSVPANSPGPLKLTYSPTLAGHWNDIGSNEAPYVCFWDELDYIGVNAYPHLNLVPTSPATEQLASGWNVFKRLMQPKGTNAATTTDDLSIDGSQYMGTAFNFTMPATAPLSFTDFDLTRPKTDANSYKARYNTSLYSVKWYADYVIDAINERFKTSLTSKGRYPLKAIITEVGAPSSFNVQGYWGNSYGGSTFESAYVNEQARGWDGYLRALRDDSRIHGISMWGLRPYHDRATPLAGWPIDWQVDYDFNGKAATEEVVCKWFKSTAPSPTCYGP